MTLTERPPEDGAAEDRIPCRLGDALVRSRSPSGWDHL